MSKFACLQGQICEENKKRVSVACYGIACFARTTRVTVGQYAFYCHKIYLRFVSFISSSTQERAGKMLFPKKLYTYKSLSRHTNFAYKNKTYALSVS